MKKAIFSGLITTRTPMLIMLPTDRDDYPIPKTKVLVDRDGNKEPVEVPVIPPNKIRGMLRRKVAYDILQKFDDLSYDAIIFLTSGGVMVPKSERGKLPPIDQLYKSLEELRNKHITADLFGGCLPSGAMFEGKLRVFESVARCRETHGEGYPFSIDLITDGLGFIRKDDILSNYDAFCKLSKEGVDEVFKRRQAKVKSKEEAAATGAKRKQTEAETAEFINSGIDAVATNVEFDSLLEIVNPKPRDIGAIIRAFEKFSKDPQIGGFKRWGWGLVEFHYKIYVDGEKTGEIKGGFKLIKDHGLIETYFDKSGSLDNFTHAYDSYIASIKKEDIQIPTFDAK